MLITTITIISSSTWGSLCQYSDTLTVKTCFLVLKRNLLCFNLWPLSLGLSPNTTERVPSSLYILFRHLCTFPSPGGRGLAFSAFPHIVISPLLDSLLYIQYITLMHRRDQNWNQYSRCGLTSAEWRRRITSLNLLILCLIQPRTAFAAFATRPHCWLMYSLVFT